MKTENLTFKQREILSKWFIKRFNKSPINDLDYYNEWVARFEKGEEYFKLCMDSESLRAWREVTA